MEKTIFKGYVNGKTFTTVEDYNKAITDAIKNNEQLISYSKYDKIVDSEKKIDSEKKNKEIVKSIDTTEIEKFNKNLKYLNDFIEKELEAFWNPFTNLFKF